MAKESNREFQTENICVMFMSACLCVYVIMIVIVFMRIHKTKKPIVYMWNQQHQNCHWCEYLLLRATLEMRLKFQRRANTYTERKTKSTDCRFLNSNSSSSSSNNKNNGFCLSVTVCTCTLAMHEFVWNWHSLWPKASPSLFLYVCVCIFVLCYSNANVVLLGMFFFLVLLRTTVKYLLDWIVGRFKMKENKKLIRILHWKLAPNRKIPHCWRLFVYLLIFTHSGRVQLYIKLVLSHLRTMIPFQTVCGVIRCDSVSQLVGWSVRLKIRNHGDFASKIFSQHVDWYANSLMTFHH